MIFTDRTIIVQKGTSSINDTIILYRGDKGVEIRFSLNEGSPFRFGSGAKPNIIEKTEAAYGQLVIKTPNDLPSIFSEVAPTNEGKITFTITAEMIDEITEVGNYTFQIRLFDESMNSRATLPEVVDGIEIREPIATEDVSATNEVNVATVGYALTTAGATEDAFDTQGNYNKTTWKTGDRITAAKLNKIEVGIDGVNIDIIDGRIGADGTTYNNIGSSIRSQISNIENTISQINGMHSDLLPLIPKWRKIEIDGRNGNETESSTCRSTIKYSFNAGETVYGSDLTNVEYYWYVYQYTSEGVFEKMLINTQKVFSFIAEEGKKYAFQLWYGGTDFSKISSAQISVTNSTRNRVKDIETMYHGEFDYLVIDWIQGSRINTGSGGFQEDATFMRSDYISIPHNEEVTLFKYGDWYWFVNTYDKKTLEFKGCIVDTKSNASFIADANLVYVFALWSGDTYFGGILNNYKIKVTRDRIKDYLYDKSLNVVQWYAKLDLPDFMVIGKGESIELFKYGMFYTNAPKMQNLFTVRLVNIGDYTEDYSERIIVKCPPDFSGTEIRTGDLPFFQLLDVNGTVVDSKRVHIYVIDKSISLEGKTVAYIGDSLTAGEIRSKYTSAALASNNVPLVGKFTGDTDINKYTAHGGCTWWNYLENPSKLPSARPENHLWDSSTNEISLQKFYNEVNGGNPVDVMVILLGWNDLENGAFNIPELGIGIDKISQNVRRFLNIVKEQSPNTKVILESYHYGYPGLIKGAYASSMPQIIHNKHVKELNELYLTVSKEFNNVYFLPNSTRVDVLHGMTTDKIAVNKYSTEKQVYCLDAVHPADIGYHQYSDAEVDMILYVLSK